MYFTKGNHGNVRITVWPLPFPVIYNTDEILKFQIWKEAKELEVRVKLAQSGRYKQYRRYMKNNDNRMTFDDS